MYGDHDYETAAKIAKEKSTPESQCVVLPSDVPGKFTIGVPIKAMSGAEFKTHLLNRFGAK